MEYYINFDSFEEFKNMFEKKIDEFNEEVYNVFKSCGEVEWVGIGHDVTINAIYKEINELGKISKKLYRFLDFMENVTDNYSEGIEDVKKHFYEVEDMIGELKVREGER